MKPGNTVSDKKYSDLTKEQLINLLTKRDAQRKLGLVWERDEIEADKARNTDFVALDLDEKLSFGDAPYENLVIEGDNFDALRALLVTHRRKIKCIYIDPPYNTGNKDWVYNDNYVSSEDRFRHSTWLEFMYQRLVLARDLLSDDGVILVSINDDNRSLLDMLLSQIMPGKRLGSFVWRNRQGSNADQDCFLSVDHEHVLAYGGEKFRFLGLEKTYEMYSNPDNDPRGDWRSDNLTLGFNYKERPNLYYPLHDPSQDIYYPANPEGVWRYASRARLKPGVRVQAKPMEEFIEIGQIIFPQNQTMKIWNTMEELLAAIDKEDVPKSGKTPLLRRGLPDLEYWVGKKVGFGRPSFKRYKADLKNQNQPISSWISPKSEVDNENEETLVSGTNQEGTKVVTTIFQDKRFNYAKPLSLLQALVKQSTTNNDIVLDFFAGSGTTAHAVLDTNKEDGGHRKFIMVSSTEATEKEPDKNLCKDVLRERIKRVIERDKKLKGTNFAYARAKRVGFFDLAYDLHGELIWTLIQLQNDIPVTPYNSKLFIQSADKPEVSIVYVDQFTDKAKKELEKLCAEGPVVAYSWAPGQVREGVKSDNLEVRPVPDELIRGYKS